MSKFHRVKFSVLAATLSLLLGITAAAADVRIHGATTVSFGLIKPNKEKIERMSGATINILPSSTTRGLMDLAQGRADVVNQQVILVGEPTSSPHKLVAEALAIAYPPELRVVQNTNQTAMIVAQAPGALSYISTAHDLPERGKLKVVESGVKLPLQLYLAYRKDAPEQVKKVVDASASLGE